MNDSASGKDKIEENIHKAAQALRAADAILITAGAGIGVDSGLPDFRGNEGFWKAYPPIARLGISFVEMANPQWFETDPKLAWAFYGHRLNLYRRTIPHQGFTRLLDVSRQKKGGYFVFTSNVDGQFQNAGFSDDRIEECHGSIHYFQCSAPCGNKIWSAENIQVKVDEDKFEAQSPLPLCPNCGDLARPNILMFGDWNWISNRTNDQGTRIRNWLKDAGSENSKLVIVELGAGEAVPTVRMKSESAAQRHNGILIRINPRDHHVPHGHIPISLGSAEGIERICENL